MVEIGARGPIPKRSDKRLGHVAKAKKAAVEKVVIVSCPTCGGPTGVGERCRRHP